MCPLAQGFFLTALGFGLSVPVEGVAANKRPACIDRCLICVAPPHVFQCSTQVTRLPYAVA